MRTVTRVRPRPGSAVAVCLSGRLGDALRDARAGTSRARSRPLRARSAPSPTPAARCSRIDPPWGRGRRQLHRRRPVRDRGGGLGRGGRGGFGHGVRPRRRGDGPRRRARGGRCGRGPVVPAAVLVPVALAASPATTASSTISRGSRRMRRNVTWRLSPAVGGPATVWPRLFTGCRHHRRGRGDGQLDALSVSTGGAPRLALLFELLLLDLGRVVRLLDELLAA